MGKNLDCYGCEKAIGRTCEGSGQDLTAEMVILREDPSIRPLYRAVQGGSVQYLAVQSGPMRSTSLQVGPEWTRTLPVGREGTCSVQVGPEWTRTLPIGRATYLSVGHPTGRSGGDLFSTY